MTFSNNPENITDDLERELLNQALTGKRDGYKNLESYRRKLALNEVIYEKFGIGENI
jgi:hypothetical protein